MRGGAKACACIAGGNEDAPGVRTPGAVPPSYTAIPQAQGGITR